ncbi:expressed unknown protein [Seminavis robusta]|uniref:DUF305 domain-containing protein n=1 Tax=Seminavis robusta TaxID=568900 RepID=A0A9N8EF57_9STRA|nr:expressed unknown protein [Seminavis robusta]|eukprot:Sro854_g211230.1 n/a (401) ;mRNA; r:20938-22559
MVRYCMVILGSLAAMASAQDICMSPTSTFTVKVNLFASELGYYAFEECGDVVNPTIGMEVGETYTFVQADRSNYFHPMGFSYFPDGAHDGVDELEPGIGLGSDASCAETLSCPAPMYFLNDDYLGNYSNIEEVLPVSTGAEDFGLDAYEPLFFHPMPEWVGYGEFSIQLRFDDESYDKDIFYFCHIHQFMSGRIKLMKNGELVSPEDEPPLGYTYDEPGAFDETCGTYGLDAFQLPHPECPSTFVCDAGPENQPFASCINAMNCHMVVGMTTGVSSESNLALFIHQMIPHHQNAVNMAKTLLLTGDVPCEDLTNDEDPYCVMQVILREIVNGQNFQIQAMRGLLEALNLPATDDCTVPVAIDGLDGLGSIVERQNPPPIEDSEDGAAPVDRVGGPFRRRV